MGEKHNTPLSAHLVQEVAFSVPLSSISSNREGKNIVCVVEGVSQVDSWEYLLSKSHGKLDVKWLREEEVT